MVDLSIANCKFTRGWKPFTLLGYPRSELWGWAHGSEQVNPPFSWSSSHFKRLKFKKQWPTGYHRLSIWKKNIKYNEYKPYNQSNPAINNPQYDQSNLATIILCRCESQEPKLNKPYTRICIYIYIYLTYYDIGISHIISNWLHIYREREREREFS